MGEKKKLKTLSYKMRKFPKDLIDDIKKNFRFYKEHLKQLNKEKNKTKSVIGKTEIFFGCHQLNLWGIFSFCNLKILTSSSHLLFSILEFYHQSLSFYKECYRFLLLFRSFF